MLGVVTSLGTACGPSVETAPGPPPACVTSFVCPVGERCDDGRCVPDTACPGPITPRVVYSPTQAELNGFLAVTGGHEYWESSDAISADTLSTETRFVDLASRVHSTFHHTLGWAGCSGDPFVCVVGVPNSPFEVASGVHLDVAKGAWIAASSVAGPAGWSVFSRDEPAAGQWVLMSATALGVWTPGPGAPAPLFDVDPMGLLVGVVDAPGQPKAVIRLGNVPAPAAVDVATLAPGASFSTLFAR